MSGSGASRRFNLNLSDVDLTYVRTVRERMGARSDTEAISRALRVAATVLADDVKVLREGREVWFL